MNERSAFANDSVAVTGQTSRALMACGLWLRLGFVGASAAMVGIVALFEGDGTPLSALALAAGGAALAVLGWRRAYAAIDHTGQTETGVTNMPSGEISTAGGA